MAVDAELAEDLSAFAVSQNKTVFGLTNEIVQNALRVLHDGGSPAELHSSWKVLRLIREIGGVPLLPRNLLEDMIQRIYAQDKDGLLQMWFEKGQRLGEHLRMFYTDPDDLTTAVEEIRTVLPAQRIELRRVAPSDGGRARLILRLVADISQPFTECVERLLSGILSTFGYRQEEARVSQGIIEITAVRDPYSTEAQRAEARTAEETEGSGSK